MKTKIILILITTNILVSISSTAQTKSKICHVVYKNKNNSGWNYLSYFDEVKVLFTMRHYYETVRDFPVYKDNQVFKSNDTVLYKKEYYEHLNYVRKTDENAKHAINERYYTSNIVRRNLFFVNDPKAYLLIDTLQENLNWEIEQDTLSILGFICQKAVTKYKNITYHAYFTIEIPFSGGPFNFRGLPGLILKIDSESGKIGYVAKEIIYPYSGNIVSLKSDATIISKAESEKLAAESSKKSLEALNLFLTNPQSGNKQ
ncbi:MAG: GLPGLI family protein [Hydrotalea sp.]|nr:GLPGLI family protein [Hydrotalea sp.]